jgi:hypothetical protein
LESALLAAHHDLIIWSALWTTTVPQTVPENGILRKSSRLSGERGIDGHDHDRIREAQCNNHDAPLAVIARTIKGRGIKDMENEPAWHHRAPNPQELARFLEELA